MDPKSLNCLFSKDKICFYCILLQVEPHELTRHHKLSTPHPGSSTSIAKSSHIKTKIQNASSHDSHIKLPCITNEL